MNTITKAEQGVEFTLIERKGDYVKIRDTAGVDNAFEVLRGTARLTFRPVIGSA